MSDCWIERLLASSGTFVGSVVVVGHQNGTVAFELERARGRGASSRRVDVVERRPALDQQLPRPEHLRLVAGRREAQVQLARHLRAGSLPRAHGGRRARHGDDRQQGRGAHVHFEQRQLLLDEVALGHVQGRAHLDGRRPPEQDAASRLGLGLGQRFVLIL